MIKWHQHRLWLGLWLGALMLFGLSTPVVGFIRQKAEQDLSQTKLKVTQATHDLDQLREDITTTQKLQNQIDAEDVTKTLAPMDRLRAVTLIERRAAQTRLQNIHTSLSPETRAILDTVGAGPQNLANSHLVFSADAATDLDFYRFIDGLHQRLPGRLTLRHMVLERTGASEEAITATNLHVSFEADWLSNESNLQVDKGAP